MTEHIEETPNNEGVNHNNESSKPKKKNKFAVKEEITEENCKFTEGQILKFVKVRFPGHAKGYSFLVGNRTLVYGKKVVAMSDRGMAVGYINSFPYEIPFKKELLPLRSINKAATDEDISKEIDTYKKQKEIETLCQNLIDKHNLDMNLTHVEFTQFGKKVIFYFVAPSRVDFRGLVKDLVNELKLRIELRQISVRDRAASQGAIGPCGRELCCSSFLSKYGNVSIKLAKNQNLSLNYSKLNGVCGQLKCCLSYEDEVYSQKRKKLPNEGDLILTHHGDSGKVKKINILNQQFDLLTDKGLIRRYTFDQLKKKYKENEYKFPRHFDNISDDTANVIGVSELEDKLARQLKRDKEKAAKRAKKFAHERILELSDFLPERDRSNDLVIEETPEKEEVQEEISVKSVPESKSSHPEQEKKDEREQKPRGNYKKGYRGNQRRRSNNRNRKNNSNNHNQGRSKPRPKDNKDS